MSNKNKSIEELIEEYKSNQTLFNELKESYSKEIEFNKVMRENEKEALKLLENPTKENLQAVKDYLRNLCGLFKVPFKDELDLDSINYQ